MTTTDPVQIPELITIPSSDVAFRAHVARIASTVAAGPSALEQRLRRVFPRVVVRDRGLTGESRAWYVYRDGRWRPPSEAWWEAEAAPRVVVSPDGWVVSANPTAAGLLGIDPRDAHEYHFTDFVNPGALDDSVALFDSILEGRPLDATILLRPISGDVLAVDLHAVRRGGEIVGVMRFADDLDMAVEPLSQVPAVTLVTSPATDVAFRVFALRAMGRMPEPTPDGLALRLHRVYPHATVHPDGGTWTAAREPSIDGQASDDWWREPGLARVRCDARALILEANDAACELFGRDLVGHHWQEFAVPGSSDAVTVMLDILREAGAAETRFRLPRADGTLLEFDSYTTVTGGDFATIMRPVETPESDASRRREKQPPPTDREVRSQTGA